jgi:hypothetical protein
VYQSSEAKKSAGRRSACPGELRGGVLEAEVERRLQAALGRVGSTSSGVVSYTSPNEEEVVVAAASACC